MVRPLFGVNLILVLTEYHINSVLFWTASSMSLFRARSGNFRPTSLGFSDPGLPGFLSHCCASSGSLYVAAGSEHGSQSQAHSCCLDRVYISLIQTTSANNEWSLQSEIVTRGLKLRQWTCHSPHAVAAFLSSCLRFWSHWHWRVMLRQSHRTSRGGQCSYVFPPFF